MGQKVNPHGLRVGIISDWDSRWYAEQGDFADNLIEDYKIREFLKKKLKDAGISKVEIERASDRVKVIVFTAKPGIVIGKGGQEIEVTKKALSRLTDKKIMLEIKEIKNPNDTHKYNAKSCIKELNKRIEKQGIVLKYSGQPVKMNMYHFGNFTSYFGMKENERMCFVYQIQSQPQYSYSQQAIDFIFEEIKKTPDTILDDLKEKTKKSTPGAKDSKH